MAVALTCPLRPQDIMVSSQIKTFLPLLMTASIVLAAHGLQLTYVAVRAAHEGFSLSLIGAMSATFSIGFACGCLSVFRLFPGKAPREVLAILACVASLLTVSMIFTQDPGVWIVTRFCSGFAYAGLLVTIESCINAVVTNAYRARVLAAYRLINLTSVALAQYGLPLAATDGPAVFLIISVALLIAQLPILRIETRAEIKVPTSQFNLCKAWRISPLTFVGCVASGLTVTTFRSTGPAYAHSIGLAPSDIANFMSAGIIGGLILQYPLGLLSDRKNRTVAILVTTLGALAAEICLATSLAPSHPGTTLAVLTFGAFSFPLYALSAARGNDRAQNGDYVVLAATLLFLTSIGGAVGSASVSVLMEMLGEKAFFTYMMAIHGFMAICAIFTLALEKRRRIL